MAWTASGIFTDNIKDALEGGDIDFNNATNKIALFNNSVAPAFDTANAQYGVGVWAANEVSGTGWAAGGVLLTGNGLTAASPAAGQLKYDAVDVSETGTTLSNIYGCLIYDDGSTSPAVDLAICGLDLSGPYNTVAGTLTITWHANGLWYIDMVV
jgi:hypothetical protein